MAEIVGLSGDLLPQGQLLPAPFSSLSLGAVWWEPMVEFSTLLPSVVKMKSFSVRAMGSSLPSRRVVIWVAVFLPSLQSKRMSVTVVL